MSFSRDQLSKFRSAAQKQIEELWNGEITLGGKVYEVGITEASLSDPLSSGFSNGPGTVYVRLRKSLHPARPVPRKTTFLFREKSYRITEVTDDYEVWYLTGDALTDVA